MAITIVGAGQVGQNASGANVTLTFNVAPSEGDVVIVFGGHYTRASSPLGPSTANYDILYVDTSTTASFGIWRKRMGASPDSNVVCQGSGNAADAGAYGSVVLRGANPSVLDNPITGATGSTGAPNSPAIVVQTAGTWIIIAAGSAITDSSVTKPAAYTLIGSQNSNGTNDYTTSGAYREIASPTTEDPAAWTGWSNSVWRAVSVAIRPAVLVARTVPQADLTLTKTAPTLTLSANHLFMPLRANLSISSTGFELSSPHNISPAQCNLALTKTPPTFTNSKSYVVVASTGTISITGATSQTDIVIVGEIGSFAINGQSMTPSMPVFKRPSAKQFTIDRTVPAVVVHINNFRIPTGQLYFTDYLTDESGNALTDDLNQPLTTGDEPIPSVVLSSGPQSRVPSSANRLLSPTAPTVQRTGMQNILPITAEKVLNSVGPTLGRTYNHFLELDATDPLSYTTEPPLVGLRASPPAAQIHMGGQAPDLSADQNVGKTIPQGGLRVSSEATALAQTTHRRLQPNYRLELLTTSEPTHSPGQLASARTNRTFHLRKVA